MATYYTICAQRHDYDEWASENLYESFDDACDAMDEEIQNYDEYRISEYKKPNREEKFKQIQERGYVVYHRSPREHEFIIKTMKVVPKKPTKKYVYQYFVQKFRPSALPNEKYELLKKSEIFTSFYECCDAIDKDLRERHEAIGEFDWKPRMNREEFREYMGGARYSTYDFFDNGEPTAETYVMASMLEEEVS